MKQFELASAKPKVKGSVLYSAKNLVENKVGIADAVKAIYGKKVLPPYLGRTAAVLPPTPDNIRLNGADLSWGAVSNVAYYAIYKDNGKERKADLVGITQGTSFKLSEKGVYFVTSLFKNNCVLLIYLKRLEIGSLKQHSQGCVKNECCNSNDILFLTHPYRFMD